MTDLRKAAEQALRALEAETADTWECNSYHPKIYTAIIALREALAQPEQEPVSIRAVAKRAGINLPETYIPTMDDAIAAGNSVLMDEQAALLRECRAALDSLIAQKPTIAAFVCGSTTLGNLKAELSAYRPQGVFGSCPQAREQPEQEHWDAIPDTFNRWWDADYDDTGNPFRKDSPAYWAWSGWKAASKQPEQEPDYWLGYGLQAYTEKPFEGATPLYTAPPQRKPLTNEQERKEFEQWYVENVFNFKANPIWSRQCDLQWSAWKARAAHGIKGDA